MTQRVRRQISTGWSVCVWSVALSVVIAFPTAYSAAKGSTELSHSVPALSVFLSDDAPPPAPVITKAPPTITYGTSAHFEFSEQGKYGSFECRLDNAPFDRCDPAGISYQGLGLGRHCFYVLAVRGADRSSPTGFCWRCQPIRLRGDFTIGGNAPNLFYPGTSEPLDLVISNPVNFAIKVLTVAVTVEPVPAKDGVPDPACPASTNLLVTRSLGTTVVVAGRSTRSLSDLGVPQAEWPVLTMPDLPTNQDACEGAIFTLLYSGSATMGALSPVQTWTVLISSPDPSAFGHAVTLTAIVAKSWGPGIPIGSVSFYAGDPDGRHILLGSSRLDAGTRATWGTSGLEAGTTGLYAVYTGGTNFADSTSPVIFQLVVAPRASRPSTFGRSLIARQPNSPIGAPQTTPVPAVHRYLQSSSLRSWVAYYHDTFSSRVLVRVAP